MSSVEVMDAAGGEAWRTLNLTVVPPSPLGRGGNDPYLYVGVGAAILAVAAVVLVLLLRRRRPSDPTTAGPQEPWKAPAQEYFPPGSPPSGYGPPGP